jgi:hypothetical protein
METGIYEIGLSEGRIYRIFVANSTQSRKVMDIYYALEGFKSIRVFTSGVHTAKQWESIAQQED